MTPAKAKPGTERYRDERRSGGGPRMHGQKWHDHAEPHDIERLEGGGRPARARTGAVMETADERRGMGKHVGRKAKGATRVNNTSPRGKGKPGINSGRTSGRARSATTKKRR